MPFSLSSQAINWANVGIRAAIIVITWVVVWILARYVGQWFARFFERVRDQTADRTGINVLRSLFAALAVTMGVVITLAALGLAPLLLSLLATAGVTGIIIGFAVKDVAANLISGMFLLVDRPFSLGDFVAAGNVQGTVENIALRSTRIRTIDGPVISIPNSIIAANAITNYTVNPNHRFVIVWTLPLDADVDAASQALLEVAAADSRLSPDAPPQVLMGDLHSGSYDLQLICQASNSIWWQVQSDLKRALIARAHDRSLSAGLPTQIVYTAPAPDPVAHTTDERPHNS